jgi:general secretion pathway protein G
MFQEYLKKLRHNDKGFTMIEMMVVLIIIAVLIGVGIKFYLGYIEGSKVTKAKGQISTVQGALDAYYSEKASYPDPSKEDEMLNAGIKPKEGSTDGTLDSTDPWGINYVYSTTDKKAYYVKLVMTKYNM